MMEPGFTPTELARRWGLSPQTLRQWRAGGTGPPWHKRPRMGCPRGQSLVFYPLPGVLAFEQAQGITPLHP
jgi:hypothetical protein